MSPPSLMGLVAQRSPRMSKLIIIALALHLHLSVGIVTPLKTAPTDQELDTASIAGDFDLGGRPRGDSGTTRRKPNIVFFITDDQDQLLGGSFPPTDPGGATPMPKTKRILQDQGMVAQNWYIHTPICSPSRSQLLTGRYFHNIKEVGPSYMHVNYSYVNDNTFIRTMKEKGGYSTGMFGKYVNTMPKAVPPGFDAWLANGGGDYIAPKFQSKGIAGLPDGEVSFSADPANYSTSVIGNFSVDWIKKVASTEQPFMAYIAPKAAHEPFNPPLWYRDFWDPTWPETEPRPVNWNCSKESRKEHHGNIASEKMLSAEAATVITGVFKNRWRTLMAVDDLIADVVQAVDDVGQLGNTYFFFTSDHGFQLGQFNIPFDKRHVYEWDTKIHLLARGPGIRAGSSLNAPGTNVDIAPTLLDLAGVTPDHTVLDGRSVMPFLLDTAQTDQLPIDTRSRLAELVGNNGEGLAAYAAKWRQEIFIEYYFVDPNIKCVGCGSGAYPERDADCADLASNSNCWCASGEEVGDCYAVESTANNYVAIRSFEANQNIIYANFASGNMASGTVDFEHAGFVEYYNVTSDPWQMENLAQNADRRSQVEVLSRSLSRWSHCAGASCP